MTISRSELHKEANDLDREMHRVVMLLDAFTNRVTHDDAERVHKASVALGRARTIVRHYMHADDREATKYA